MAGIVNPMGPTLGILAADGEPKPGSSRRVLWFNYNPFTQDCSHVGDVLFGEEWTPVKDLSPFMDIPFGAVPTLLIAGNYLEAADAVALFSQMLGKFHHGAETLRLLRRFPGDPWKRVQEEMNGVSGILRSNFEGAISDKDNLLLSDDDACDFAAMQLDLSNAQKEFHAFLDAWDGAINFTGIESAVPMQEFVRQSFSHFAITARMQMRQDGESASQKMP